MLASLQPCFYTCGTTLNKQNFSNLKCQRYLSGKNQPQRVLVITAGQDPAVTGCSNRGQSSPRLSLPSAIGVLLASFLTADSIIASPALARAAPPNKSDPYEDLQSIIKSRGGDSPGSLFERFKKSAVEAAKAPAEALKTPAEALKAPVEIFRAPEPEAPSPLLPITKADPVPTKTKAVSGASGVSGGLLAAVGALVAAAGLAFNARGGAKAPTPKPNKIKAKVKGGAKSVNKQASQQPSSAFSFLGNKAGGSGKVKAGQVGKTAKIKAGQVGKTAKIKAGAAKQKAQTAPQKAGLFGTGSTRPKQVAAKASGGLFGTGSTRPKQAAAKASGGLFGTGSTRPKQAAAKASGGLFGTGSTRPGTGSTRPGTKSTRPGGTTKVKAPTPGKAAKRAANTGGSNLLQEDSGTTVGALGVVGLAVAVGGLVISSLGGSGGAGRGSSAESPTKALLDRVPEPLPVTQKLQQAGTQVANKRTPLAPPLTDSNKPKAPSGPDLRPPNPSPSANSLGATPQLASSLPTPSLPSVPKAAEDAAAKVSEAIPQIAEEAETPAESNPVVLLGLVALTVGSAVLATQSGDSESSDSSKTTTSPALGKTTSAPMNGAPARSAEAPQTAEAAAEDAKGRAKEARQWIDNWKSKQ